MIHVPRVITTILRWVYVHTSPQLFEIRVVDSLFLIFSLALFKLFFCELDDLPDVFDDETILLDGGVREEAEPFRPRIVYFRLRVFARVSEHPVAAHADLCVGAAETALSSHRPEFTLVIVITPTLDPVEFALTNLIHLPLFSRAAFDFDHLVAFEADVARGVSTSRCLGLGGHWGAHGRRRVHLDRLRDRNLLHPTIPLRAGRHHGHRASRNDASTDPRGRGGVARGGP